MDLFTTVPMFLTWDPSSIPSPTPECSSLHLQWLSSFSDGFPTEKQLLLPSRHVSGAPSSPDSLHLHFGFFSITLPSTTAFAHLLYSRSSSASGGLVQGGRAFIFLMFCYNVSSKVCLPWQASKSSLGKGLGREGGRLEWRDGMG